MQGARTRGLRMRIPLGRRLRRRAEGTFDGERYSGGSTASVTGRGSTGAIRT